MDDRVDEIADLLRQAGQAHARHEQTELKGVYDKAWARWYAGYVVEQGISALIGHMVTVDRLAQFFAESFADYKRDGVTESWDIYTARRIQAEL
ncbi:MAG: hypothetical protein LC121_17850 [Anaerolineae bacterium]|nr:hypothetical protein [Anaerolineae bacterium]